MSYELDDCAAYTTGGAEEIFADTVDNQHTLYQCTEKCKLRGGVSFKYGLSTAAGHCVCYKATCAKSPALSALWNVYNVQCPCYWTTANSYRTSKTCVNFDILAAAGSVNQKVATNTHTVQSCHALCHANHKCTHFFLGTTGSATEGYCNIIEPGCIFQSDTTYDTWTRSGYKQPSETAGECTQYYPDNANPE